MNARAAAALNGRLLLRFDDLDRTRSRTQYESAIERDLEWLGVRFDAPARRQSDHVADYDAALGPSGGAGIDLCLFLQPSGRRLFAASPTTRMERRSIRAPAGRLLRTKSQRGLRRATGPSGASHMRRALELAPAPVDWIEFGEGQAPSTRVAEPALWGDIILRGRDSAASYHLAVAVDDALQGVTDVVRGRDLLAATSLHRLLQELLGLPAPRYRHHRLVRDPNGAKLSKSRQSTSLATLRKSGVGPNEIRAALGLGSGDSGGLVVSLS